MKGIKLNWFLKFTIELESFWTGNLILRYSKYKQPLLKNIDPQLEFFKIH
jgi:hypothetical protein